VKRRQSAEQLEEGAAAMGLDDRQRRKQPAGPMTNESFRLKLKLFLDEYVEAGETVDDLPVRLMAVLEAFHVYAAATLHAWRSDNDLLMEGEGE
jgi:hypothetical protein